MEVKEIRPEEIVDVNNDHKQIRSTIDKIEYGFSSYDEIIVKHSEKLGELNDQMEQADNLIVDMLNYINGDLYNWVVETENESNRKTRQINHITNRCNDIEYDTNQNGKDIKYLMRLTNSLCVNTYESLKTLNIVMVAFAALCTGALLVGIFSYVDNPDPFYAILSLVSFIFGAFGIAIACCIKDMKNSFRATYRMLYHSLKSNNSNKVNGETEGI